MTAGALARRSGELQSNRFGVRDAQRADRSDGPGWGGSPDGCTSSRIRGALAAFVSAGSSTKWSRALSIHQKTRRRAKSTVRKTLTRRGENPRVQHTQVVLPRLKTSHVAQLPSSRPVTFAFGCVQRLPVLAQRGMKGAVRGVTIDIVPPARDHPRSVQGGERIRRSMYIRVFTESA